jgi:hypothetical protein
LVSGFWLGVLLEIEELISRLTDLNRWPSLYLCPGAPDTSHCKAFASPFINH